MERGGMASAECCSGISNSVSNYSRRRDRRETCAHAARAPRQTAPSPRTTRRQPASSARCPLATGRGGAAATQCARSCAAAGGKRLERRACATGASWSADGGRSCRHQPRRRLWPARPCSKAGGTGARCGQDEEFRALPPCSAYARVLGCASTPAVSRHGPRFRSVRGPRQLRPAGTHGIGACAVLALPRTDARQRRTAAAPRRVFSCTSLLCCSVLMDMRK